MQENLRVLDIPQQEKFDLSVFLSGKFKVYTASKGSIAMKEGKRYRIEKLIHIKKNKCYNLLNNNL